MLSGRSAAFRLRQKRGQRAGGNNMMPELETIPVERYLVAERRKLQGAEDFYNFDSAEDYLNDKRNKDPEKDWVLYAEVSA
jgi:hypothetical protein